VRDISGSLPPQGETISLHEGELILYLDILPDGEAMLRHLLEQLPWRQDNLQMGRRCIPIPRLQSWHGEPHCIYTYSQLQLDPLPFTPDLLQMRDIASGLAGSPLNCVLCNLYRDGRDSVAWHSDDEPELGVNPVIASFSFGTTRRFHLRMKQDHTRRLHLDLPHNSLLIMRGRLQHVWQHQLPKTVTALPRVNLTFRYIPLL
jgi:alkylated DNA repair dioxygenase AlkB